MYISDPGSRIRILDPTTATEEEGVNFVVLPFFIAKIENNLFEQVKKKI
jgi:hypothetical protein